MWWIFLKYLFALPLGRNKVKVHWNAKVSGQISSHVDGTVLVDEAFTIIPKYYTKTILYCGNKDGNVQRTWGT